MATLQLTFKDIREEVQRYLGYGRHTGFDTIATDPRGDVLSCIERVLRQFYNPAPLPNETVIAATAGCSTRASPSGKDRPASLQLDLRLLRREQLGTCL